MAGLSPEKMLEPEEKSADLLQKAAALHLVRVNSAVFVLDKEAAVIRSAGAARVAKHNEKKKAEGLAKAYVPVAVLDLVKASGGWDSFMIDRAKLQPVKPAETVLEKVPPVPVPGAVPVLEKIVYKDKIIIKHQEMTPEQQKMIDLGLALKASTGIKKWILAHFFPQYF